MFLDSPIAAYLRASSDQQEDSHERQENVIKAFLTQHGLTISPDNWFTDFRARDEANAANAGDFQSLLLKVKRKLVKTVLVSNLDRWGSQDVDEFFAFRKIMHDNGVKLWSVEDGDLTSKNMVDIITLVVKAEQSKEYVKRMAKNIASGKERNAKNGHWNGGKCSPYGFDRVLYDAKGNPLWLCHYETMDKRIIFYASPDGTFDFNNPKVMQGQRQRPPKNKTDYNVLIPSLPQYGSYSCIDGDRAKIVETIFQFVIEKPWSINKMAREMSNMGYRYYGHLITVQRMLKLLQNELYRGDLTWNKTQRAKYATCSNGQVKEITPIRHKINRRHPGNVGTLKILHKPKEDWTLIEGTHQGIVTPETWQKAQEALDQKRERYMPRSNDHYLRHLLWCGECDCAMWGKVQHGTGKNKTRVPYPGYFCANRKHWIMHKDVEKWLFEKLGSIGVEVNAATEEQALQELYRSYQSHDDKVNEFFRKGIKGYLGEVKAFYEQCGILDYEVDEEELLGMAWTLFGNDFHEHTTLKERIRHIDDQKTEMARTILAQKKEDHRLIVKKWMMAKDTITQGVLQDEIDRLVNKIKALEPETVRWSQRYEEMRHELIDFRNRLSHLVKIIEDGDQDARTQKITEMISRITLFFQPKAKGQGRTLNPDRTMICFSSNFVPNEPSS
jgi:DNA invertase Pin-like site-specific DNA recombinase